MKTKRRESMALIVAPRGALRESLAAMLVALLPQDVVILELDDAAAAEQLLREQRPALILIDGDLDGQWPQLVAAAATHRPPVPCSILVDTINQQAAAMNAGATHASFKGEPPLRLFSQVERLLGAH